MTFVDARPPSLNLAFRPGTTLTVDLEWPDGFLVGRTFTATLNGADLDVSVVGDVMTVEATAAQTDVLTGAASWLLLEDRGGAEPEPVIVGTWSPSLAAATRPATVTVITDEAATVDVTVSTGPSASVIDGKVAKAGDTMTGSLVLSGSSSDLTVGGDLSVGGASGVTMTYQAGAIDSLVLDGQLLSAHDALYVYAATMKSNGTEVPESAQDVGLPRWSLADGATQRVKWVFEIPAEWDQVAVRFGWNKENTGSGNVNWSFAYRLVYPFVADNVDAGAVTTVSLGSIAVPSTQFAFQYEIPAAISAIATADGAFGSKPFMLCSLSRDGAADTYAGAVAVSLATLTRTA